jgi:TrmH family RNA methyltransferase
MAAAVKAIASRDNPLLVRIRKLAADPGGYRKLGDIWLEGDHLCAAVLQRGGVTTQAVVTEAAWQEPRWRQLASRAAAVAVVPQALMDGLSTLESPPPLGFVVPWQGSGMLAPGVPSVVLGRIQDAGNVGTILRSASAFGFGQVIALKGTAALWSPKVLRAGMGGHFAIGILQVDDLGAAIAAFGGRTICTVVHGGRPLRDADLSGRIAWRRRGRRAERRQSVQGERARHHSDGRRRVAECRRRGGDLPVRGF